MMRLKWQSKLTCDNTSPVGGMGRRPAKPGHSRVAASFPHCGHFDSKAGMRYVMDV
jgi:hypothetical protein